MHSLLEGLNRYNPFRSPFSCFQPASFCVQSGDNSTKTLWRQTGFFFYLEVPQRANSCWAQEEVGHFVCTKTSACWFQGSISRMCNTWSTKTNISSVFLGTASSPWYMILKRETAESIKLSSWWWWHRRWSQRGPCSTPVRNRWLQHMICWSVHGVGCRSSGVTVIKNK